MKEVVLVLMVLAVISVKSSKDSGFYCCPVQNSPANSIYKAIINLTDHNHQGSKYCDNVTCSNIQKVQNLKNFVGKSSLVSITERLKNVQCRTQFSNFIYGLKNFSTWAIEMLDASSRIPSGLVAANTFQFGNYDQCINIISTEYLIKGQYCLANIQFMPFQNKYPPFYTSHTKYEYSLNYNPHKSVLEKFKVTKDLTKKVKNDFYIGICIPDTCTHEDAEIILNKFIYNNLAKFGYHSRVKISAESCSNGELKPLTSKGKILGLFVLGVTVLVIFCTIRDLKINLKKKKLRSKVEDFFKAFSLIENLSTFCNQEGDGNMNVFNGMKTLSMLLIIMGHRCMASCGGPFFNPQFLEQAYRNFITVFLLNGTLIVDTFFLIGGFLTFLSMFKEYEKTKKLNFLQIYLYRWLRIAPVYMLVIFFYGHFLEHIGTGPIWSMKVEKEAKRCRENWWTNFLFINNYVNTESLCMFQSWYVTCDMHFIIMAPIIFMLIAKSPIRGSVVLGFLILSSLGVNFFCTYFYKYDGVLRVYIKTFEDLISNFTFTTVYIKTHTRATSYFSGMAAAYLYIKLKQTNHKFPKWQVWMYSILATVLSLSAIGGAWLFYIPDREYNALENALYASLHRLLWAVSMSWLAIAGGTNSFGILEPILSQKFFIPFSKLSYSVFLVHGAIQMYSSATLRIPEHMTFVKLFWMTCGDIILSFSLAFILYIFLEAPLKRIQKLLFTGKQKSV